MADRPIALAAHREPERTGSKPAAALGPEWIRLPGLFRRWELADVIDTGEDFYFERTGTCDDGLPLFAVYHRDHQASGTTP